MHNSHPYHPLKQGKSYLGAIFQYCQVTIVVVQITLKGLYCPVFSYNPQFCFLHLIWVNGWTRGHYLTPSDNVFVVKQFSLQYILKEIHSPPRFCFFHLILGPWHHIKAFSHCQENNIKLVLWIYNSPQILLPTQLWTPNCTTYHYPKTIIAKIRISVLNFVRSAV